MIDFKQRKSIVVLEQIRTLDKIRLLKKLETISTEEGQLIAKTLTQMFSW